MIQLVDATTVLIKWNTDTDLDSVACLKPSTLSSTLMGLQAYTDQLHPQPTGGDTWCNLHIHFGMDPAEFMQELSEQTWLCKWITKQHALQMAHTKTVGWILYSLLSMNVEFWTSAVNEWIAKHFPR